MKEREKKSALEVKIHFCAHVIVCLKYQHFWLIPFFLFSLNYKTRILSASGRFFCLPKLPSCGPHQRLQRMAKGRDQVYLMSASLEKLVFLVNSSNPCVLSHGCLGVEVFHHERRPRPGSMTLNSSQNKTMLASSGQDLKEYQCYCVYALPCLASMWLALQASDSGQSAAFHVN